MKCPACGFETPIEQGYCDFCKEPFKKEASVSSAEPPKKVDVPPSVLAKLLEDKKESRSESKPKKDLGDIVKEFAHLDAGGKVEEVSPLVRQMAWAFLAILVIWMLIAMMWMVNRASSIRDARTSRPLLLFLFRT